MKKQFSIAWICTLAAATAFAADSDVQKALEREAQQQEAKPYKWSATAAFDFYAYAEDYGSSGLYAGTDSSGTLDGSMFGGLVTLGMSPIYLDIGYRQGSLEGDIKYPGPLGEDVPTDTEADRQEIELRVSVRKGVGLFGLKGLGGLAGLDYTYISQDIAQTLPGSYYWDANGNGVYDPGEGSRDYTEPCHLLMADVGAQYTFWLMRGEKITLRALPKVLGGFGFAYFPDGSVEGSIEEGDVLFAYKLQATGQFEVQLAEQHTVFLEGGYKMIGTTAEDIASRDFNGPYVRVGYSLAW